MAIERRPLESYVDRPMDRTREEAPPKKGKTGKKSGKIDRHQGTLADPIGLPIDRPAVHMNLHTNRPKHPTRTAKTLVQLKTLRIHRDSDNHPQNLTKS